MELRSSRSRSRTPFLQSKIDQEIISESKNHVEESVVQYSYNTRNKIISSNNSSILSDEVFMSPTTQTSSTHTRARRSRQKTSDYSSEDGENEISSSKTENNDLKTYINNSSNTSNGKTKTPLEIYREAKEYWNVFPKTDYTYSRHSKDRVEVAPGLVAMPNMSRRSIRRSMEPTSVNHNTHETSSSSYSKDTTDYVTVNNYNHRLRPRALFGSETEQRVTIFRRIRTTITRIVTSIWTTILLVLATTYQTSASSMLWCARAYYKIVSRLLLLDTWLLQSSTTNRRWGYIFALMFLPLFLFTGWWLWSDLSHILHGAFITSTTTTTESIQIPSPIPTPPSSAEYLKTAIVQEQQLDIDEFVKKLLDHPEFENKIIDRISKRTFDLNKRIDALAMNSQMENARMQANFASELNKCCRRQYIYIESYVKRLLADLIGLPKANIQPDDISRWLHTIFVAKQDLELRLANLTQTLHTDYDNLIELSAAKIMNDVTEKINLRLRERLLQVNTNSIGVDSALTDSQVQRIVKEVLVIYDADKTGLVDYALEPSGGQIISTRCTESYNARTAVLSVLGIPLWYPSNTPRIVITPGVTPGECWAFQNFPGYLVIQLTATVRISAVSLEHIPKSLAPAGRRDSAPKDFSVWGLKAENDRDPLMLGKYQYDLDGPSLQFFTVEDKEAPPFNIVELRIESNHGNMNYTCLYRFRVHGILSDEPT